MTVFLEGSSLGGLGLGSHGPVEQSSGEGLGRQGGPRGRSSARHREPHLREGRFESG